MSNATVRLSTLGSVELTGPGGEVVRSVLNQPRRTALLVYLAAARPRGLHRRDSLLATFWQDSSERSARDLLNTNLSRLRSSLGANAIVASGQEEVGIDAGRLWCDVAAFEQALEDGRHADALELYRGDFLDGFHISDAPAFEQWLAAERARLRARAANAAFSLAEEHAASHDATGARSLVARAASLADDDETQLRRAMSILVAIGDRAAALERYARFARYVRDEYDAEPSSLTRELAKRIQEAETAPELPRPEPVSRPPPSISARGVDPVVSRPQIAGVQGKWRRTGWRRGVVVAATVVVGLAASTQLVRVGQTSAAATSDLSRVAVLPFSVRGTERIGYLAEGVADILAVRLDGVGELRTVDPNFLFDYTNALGSADLVDRGRSVARHFASDYFIAGSVTEVGDRLDVSATLYDAHGRPRARAHASAEEEHLLSAMDELARELVGGQVQGANAAMLREAAVTTRSLPALKAYLEGERAQRENRLSDVRAALERAVAEDSTFALAHFRLAIAYEFTGTDALIRQAIDNAARYRERLSERHRLLVQGLQANWQGDYWESQQAYRQVVLRYPDDLEAWHRLAELQYHRMPALGHPFTEARPAFERVLAMEPENQNALQHLTRIAVYGREAAWLDSLTARALVNAEPDQAIELLVLRAFANRDPAERARATSATGALPPLSVRVLAVRVASYTGNVHAAEALLAPLVESGSPPDVRKMGHLQLSDMEAGGGRWSSARLRLRQLAPNAPVVALALEAAHGILPFAPLGRAELLSLRERVNEWDVESASNDGVPDLLNVPDQALPALRRFFLGALSVRLGDAAGAAAHADALALDSMAVQYRLPPMLRAMTALAAGRYADGLAAADSLAPGDASLSFTRQDALGRYLRGKLLRALGRDAEAYGWFGSFGDMAGWDLAFLAPGELERAEIAERRGDTAAAAHHYARVVDLWSDPDPELRPLVARAESRLRSLRRVQ